MNLAENLKKPMRARDFSAKCDMLGVFMTRQNKKVWEKILFALNECLNCNITELSHDRASRFFMDLYISLCCLSFISNTTIF